jgi:hypothetical protein
MSPKRYSHSLSQSPLYKLGSRSKLARLLKISVGDLRLLSAGDTLYREFDIPKKSGGIRHVENPARPLKLVQARLARLLSRISPPDYLYCPVKGRCYVSNAAQHAGHRVVHCLDVQKYFPSTLARRVFWFFNKIMQCERDVAALLTSLSTYQQHLPTGSPLSPIMAYFAHYDVWEAVAAFCRKRGHTLTVYVDDCTVSGSKVSARDMWEVKRLIHRSGLRYHKEKTYIDRPAEVTGVILRDGGIAVPNRQLLKLRRGKLALCADVVSPELRSQVSGLEGQIAQIRRMQTDNRGPQ